MPIKYIGRTTDYKGKTLWQILGNLKNFGVGRIIIRNRMQRYPEPSYMRILKVGALPEPTDKLLNQRKVLVLVERVFRGVLDPTIRQLDSVTYKADYMLVPKDEEYKYQPLPEKPPKILPSTIEFPPLMKELITRQFKAQNPDYTEEPQLSAVYNMTAASKKTYRVAKEGETPTVKITVDVGVPASPSLYENVKPI